MESASDQGPSGRVFDLDAIGQALQELDGWNAANDGPGASPGFEDARRRLLSGYAFVDRLLATGEDPFAYGGSPLLLELNHIVLCGTTPGRRAEFAPHIAATERRFYEDHECGADSFYDWVDENRRLRPIVFAARVYRQIVGAPQLFIEGNQRAATLVASYRLGRGGLPPLVRTRETFKAFASLSAQCKATDRRNFFVRNVGRGARLAASEPYRFDRGQPFPHRPRRSTGSPTRVGRRVTSGGSRRPRASIASTSGARNRPRPPPPRRYCAFGRYVRSWRQGSRRAMGRKSGASVSFQAVVVRQDTAGSGYCGHL